MEMNPFPLQEDSNGTKHSTPCAESRRPGAKTEDNVNVEDCVLVNCKVAVSTVAGRLGLDSEIDSGGRQEYVEELLGDGASNADGR